MSAAAKEEEQLAKDRRASRKAAAACLARQRHKSFVNGLQDSAQFVRYRIDLYKSRKGQLVSDADRERTRGRKGYTTPRATTPPPSPAPPLSPLSSSPSHSCLPRNCAAPLSSLLSPHRTPLRRI